MNDSLWIDLLDLDVNYIGEWNDFFLDHCFLKFFDVLYIFNDFTEHKNILLWIPDFKK